jgi:hypothetical protein
MVLVGAIAGDERYFCRVQVAIDVIVESELVDPSHSWYISGV